MPDNYLATSNYTQCCKSRYCGASDEFIPNGRQESNAGTAISVNLHSNHLDEIANATSTIGSVLGSRYGLAR